MKFWAAQFLLMMYMVLKLKILEALSLGWVLGWSYGFGAMTSVFLQTPLDIVTILKQFGLLGGSVLVMYFGFNYLNKQIKSYKEDLKAQDDEIKRLRDKALEERDRIIQQLREELAKK